MNRLIAKIAALCAVVGLSYLALLWAIFSYLPYYNTNRYFYAFVDKESRLRAKPGPRIIILGGSNVMYSIDSLQIERKFNRPVINMGLNVGLGLKFILDSVSDSLAHGDVILVVPEYEQFFSDAMYGQDALLDVLHVYPDGWRHISGRQYWTILKYGGGFLRTLAFRPEPADPLLSRGSFNGNGDVVSHLKEKYRGVGEVAKIQARMNPAALETLQSFADLARSRGARCYTVLPPCESSSAALNAEAFQAVEKVLSGQGTLIGSQFSVGREFIYDSRYHLNARGRVINTERIISALERQLALDGR